MEPSSKLYGDGTEECQSSESGWTMYLGSSMDDDDHHHHHGGGGTGGGVYDGGGRKKGVKVKDEDTDDSMASDASSGPSHLHLQQPWEVQEYNNKNNNNNNNNNQEKYKSSSKKNKKTSGKKKVGYDQETRKKDESEKRGHVITTVQSGNRTCFSGKRK